MSTKNTCSTADCEAEVHARGMCQKCYRREIRAVVPETVQPVQPTKREGHTAPFGHVEFSPGTHLTLGCATIDQVKRYSRDGTGLEPRCYEGHPL